MTLDTMAVDIMDRDATGRGCPVNERSGSEIGATATGNHEFHEEGMSVTRHVHHWPWLL